MNDLFVMNMKRKILFVCLSFLALLQGWAQHTLSLIHISEPTRP